MSEFLAVSVLVLVVGALAFWPLHWLLKEWLL